MLIPLLLAIMVIVDTAPEVRKCDDDTPKSIGVSIAAFDQDLTGGWRALDNQGCTLQAADLINAYRQLHLSSLTDGQRSTLNWHEGQLRANLGDYESAIPLLMQGVTTKSAKIGFADYALGTIAFLHRDKAELLASRNRLARTPRPSDFTGTVTVQRNGKAETIRFEWPPNLDVLDGLIKCFDKTYKIAYACRAR